LRGDEAKCGEAGGEMDVKRGEKRNEEGGSERRSSKRFY